MEFNNFITTVEGQVKFLFKKTKDPLLKVEVKKINELDIIEENYLKKFPKLVRWLYGIDWEIISIKKKNYLYGHESL
jgi:hypothetical protein